MVTEVWGDKETTREAAAGVHHPSLHSVHWPSWPPGSWPPVAFHTQIQSMRLCFFGMWVSALVLGAGDAETMCPTL